MKSGDLLFYGTSRVILIRGSYPRFGKARVVVERESDKRRFAVNLDKLRPVPHLETTETRNHQVNTIANKWQTTIEEAERKIKRIGEILLLDESNAIDFLLAVDEKFVTFEIRS